MVILIADADEETRLALAEAIAVIDGTAQVIEVCDGAELQSALTGSTPDVVFIDTILPGTDAAAIMAWRQTAGLRTVVVLVADLLSRRWSNIARCINAYDVILKPLDVRSVERVLRAAPHLRRDLSLLLVQPSGRARDLTLQVLEGSLFTISTIEADAGAIALRTTRMRSFDLAFVSFGIADMPALEVACRIDAQHPGTKIVLIGRRSDAMTAAQLALFGAQAYLPMPFTAADVDRLVYEVFGLWQPYLVKALREEEGKFMLDAARPALAVPA